MSPTFEEYGYTAADVQAIMSVSLHPTVLLAFCHGIHTCIFLITVYLIIENRRPNRERITLASIISFLWVANTIILSLEWEIIDHQFIAHGTSLEAEFDFHFAGDLPLELAADVLRSLDVLVADLVLIWRCWVLYGRNLKIIAIPSICTITGTISACLIIVSFVADKRFSDASRLNWSLVYYSMTVAVNSFCTILILFRIIQVSGVSASLKTYRGIIEILVESAAIYAIIYIALLIAYAYEFYTGAPVGIVFPYLVIVSYSVTGIAPTLIIARVMAGKSRPDDSWTRPSLPHMRSNVLSTTESLRFASMPNQSTQATTTNTGYVTAEIDLEAQVVEEHGGDRGSAGQKQSAVEV